MTTRLEVSFADLQSALPGNTACIVATDAVMPPSVAGLDQRSGGALRRAADAVDFKGRAKSSIEILAPAGLSAKRLVLIGCGKAEDLSDQGLVELGGQAMAQLMSRKGEQAGIIAEVPGISGRKSAEAAADIALGGVLRHYNFTKYRTKRGEREDNGGENGAGSPAKDGIAHLTILCEDPDAARAAYASRQAVADGVILARDLINEPANALGPVEFAREAEALRRAGVEVVVLDETRLAEMKMGALLGVAQGSARPPRLVVMHWNGARSKRAKPVCFVGKGVVFDTGGISMKPAAGMEDMKGDMAGAAAVTGLMLTLAARKANVNAVGLIGIVENMPSGAAQRPGDIVTSMSGQTVEVLNTDAEGRLVLADVIWYAQQEFKPKLIVDLATLTGAIIVALGKEHAGLFCNDDKLAADLIQAGEDTAEKVWRMPLGRAYDKLIDSKTADMKNIGGRWGGAITGAQFIGRFVKDTPWAHLDIAGVSLDSPRTDTNAGWSSGWGVRLLDRFVADNHEK